MHEVPDAAGRRVDVRKARAMAYSESLALRVRDLLGKRQGLTEKKLFGGVGFLLHGNLLVGVWRDSLMARLGPDEAAVALGEPHVRAFDVTGKPMRGWVLVEPDGLADDTQLQSWLERSLRFVRTLPKK